MEEDNGSQLAWWGVWIGLQTIALVPGAGLLGLSGLFLAPLVMPYIVLGVVCLLALGFAMAFPREIARETGYALAVVALLAVGAHQSWRWYVYATAVPNGGSLPPLGLIG